ncbi:unnamed protein product [Alternaria alternata]
MNVTNFDYKAANYLYRSTHFSNCSVAISILQFLNDQKQNATESEIYGYIIDSLQEYLQDTSQRPPAVSEQFWSWARGDHHNEFGYYAEVRDYVSTVCGADACRILGWDGSPDLAGVGMLATYIIQAILVTIYLLSILISRRERKPNKLPEFLSASSIFATSLLLASIVQKGPSSSTRSLLMFIIPLNSVLPVLILQLAAWDMFRRSKGKLMWWVVIDILVGVNYGRILNWDAGTSVTDGDDSCLDRSSFDPIVVFAFIIAGILIFCISIYLLISLISLIRQRPPFFERFPRMIRWSTLSAAFCIMWVFISWFVFLTLQIRNRAGQKNKDNEWTFGQVLALATWVPFMTEFAYIWWEDPEKAMSGRLMEPYEVVAAPRRRKAALEVEPSAPDRDLD